MNIRIVKNNSPNFKKIKFKSDDPLSNKLFKYKMLDENFNKYNTSILVGGMGSGKTSFMVNLITGPYRKLFHTIFVFMPDTSRENLDNNIFEEHLPEDQIFSELTYENLEYVYKKARQNAREEDDKGVPKKTLIIYDDVQKALKRKDIAERFKEMILNQRALHIVNIILLQNFFGLPKDIREVCNNVILFKLGKSQREKTFKECIELPNETYEEIIDMVYDKPHTFMLINQKTKRLYKMFDEIVLDGDDEEII